MNWSQFGGWVLEQCVAVGECWEWSRARIPDGYGHVGWNGKMFKAHRVAYAAANGLTEADLAAVEEVMHECDNKRCIRPEHLRAGTHAENMQDAGARGRISRNKLTEADVVVVRKRYLGGERVEALAREYGLTPAGMLQAIRGIAGRTCPARSQRRERSACCKRSSWCYMSSGDGALDVCVRLR